MQPLLTIGIPTWNRAETLRRGVSRLVSLIRELPDVQQRQIEVLISDNASTDSTPGICRRLQEANPDLIVINRNDTNLGFSRNVDMLFRAGTGRHVLILSDDDSLEDDTLTLLIPELSSHPDLACAYLRYTAYKNDLMTSLESEHLASLRTKYPSSRPALCFSDVASCYRHRRTLTNVCISGCVFNRNCWLDNDVIRYADSGSIQLHAALLLQVIPGGILCFERPAIRYNSGGSGGPSVNYIETCAGGWESGYPFVYPFDAIHALVSAKNLYAKSIYKSFYKVCIRDLIGILIDAKARRWPFSIEYFIRRANRDLDKTYLRFLTIFLTWLARTKSLPIASLDRIYKSLRKIYFKMIG